jgi:hypothetical protein
MAAFLNDFADGNPYKRHWNTITLDGSIPDDEILSMIDDSYNLVIKGLKKSDRKNLEMINCDRTDLT